MPQSLCSAAPDTSSLLVFFDEDDYNHEKRVRDFIKQRIAEKKPIFPNRNLGIEYAAINSGVPKGLPIASVAISNLLPGETVLWKQETWTVQAIKKTLVLVDGQGTIVRISPDSQKWDGFCRDMDSELVRFTGWDKETDLMRAWRRDPISQINAQ